MADDDIEWELSKMDEAERRREAPPLRTVYRPVDPGLKARILRMFGQPYDKSAIPRGQEFYLNGWDSGEDDGEDGGPVVKLPDFTARQGGKTRPAFSYDPWAGAWRPDWGPEGNPLRTMEERRRDDMALPSRGDVIRPLSFAASGHDGGEGLQLMSEGIAPKLQSKYQGPNPPDTKLQDTFKIQIGKDSQGLSQTGFRRYLNKLGDAESRGSGGYQAKNEGGFLGRYQLGAAALVEAGFYNYGEGEDSTVNKYNGTWTDKAKAYGIKSEEDFLNNPEAQEAAIREYSKKNWQYIVNGGYDKNIGKVIHNTKITASGLLATCHLLGPRGVGQLFGEEGPYDVNEKGVPVDGNGTPATKYLGEMGGLDLTELLGYNPDKELQKREK